MAVCCKAIKADGVRCGQVSTLNADGLCMFHDPGRKLVAQAARKKGGVAAAKKQREGRILTVEASEAPPNPKTIADCVEYASWALGAVTTGLIDPRTAREITGLLGRVQMALRDSKVADDITELRERIDEIQRDRIGVVR